MRAATTIDAVRARRGEIDGQAGAASHALIDELNARLEAATQSVVTAPGSSAQPTGTITAPTVAVPRVRPVVRVDVRAVAGKTLLETETDLQAFLQALEARLRDELARDNRVQLE